MGFESGMIIGEGQNSCKNFNGKNHCGKDSDSVQATKVECSGSEKKILECQGTYKDV